MRVAAIDVGTNTVLLLVAEQGNEEGAQPVAIAERATITRLGEGVDRARRFAPAALERTQACLRDYADIVSRCGVERVAVVGTSAMRDAAGSDVLAAAISREFGVPPRILAGLDEARLTFEGALSGLPDEGNAEEAVFDIGGGSTEVVIGRRGGGVNLSFSASYDVGSVRLTERWVTSDPPASRDLAHIQEQVLAAFSQVPAVNPGTPPIGVAGTLTTLAAVARSVVPYDGARMHGLVLPVGELRAVVARLAAADLQQRRNIPGMHPGRADVIVAGGCIALSLLELWHAPSVRISDRGVRWGLVLELFKDLKGRDCAPSRSS